MPVVSLSRQTSFKTVTYQELGFGFSVVKLPQDFRIRNSHSKYYLRLSSRLSKREELPPRADPLTKSLICGTIEPEKVLNSLLSKHMLVRASRQSCGLAPDIFCLYGLGDFSDEIEQTSSDAANRSTAPVQQGRIRGQKVDTQAVAPRSTAQTQAELGFRP